MKERLLPYAQSNYITGKVVVDKKLCTACKSCTIVCPASALEMNPKTKISQMIKGVDCISCGDCTAVCPTRAITIKTFYKVPDGFYKTVHRKQIAGNQCFPREFTDKSNIRAKAKRK